MPAADARCDWLSDLIEPWHAGTMREKDRNGYEQHLLCCPPCLAQNDKATLAFAALPSAGTAAQPPEDLMTRLLTQLPVDAPEA